jgi:hypothetical protein
MLQRGKTQVLRLFVNLQAKHKRGTNELELGK